MEERFWSKVDKKEDNECWNWLKSCSSSGYGKTWYNNKHIASHRIAYELHNRTEIPEGLVVRHKCDNKLCCNPTHLELGTSKDNSKDMVERGRSSFGEKHGVHKLTEDQVIKIKHKLINYTPGMDNQLAKEYNISKKMIINIRLGRNWKHINNPLEPSSVPS